MQRRHRKRGPSDHYATGQWRSRVPIMPHLPLRIACIHSAEPFGLPEGFVLLRLGQASSHGTIKAIRDSKWTPDSAAATVAIGKFQTLIERKVFVFSPVQSSSAASSLGPPPPWRIGATNGEKGFIVDDKPERGSHAR